MENRAVRRTTASRKMLLETAKDNIASAGNLRVSLPVELTTALLTSVPEAIYAQINDVLLTALALASFQWRRRYSATDDTTITIDLEGHGREPMDSGFDLSRTVGWFTSVFPVRLDLQDIDLQSINLQRIDLDEAVDDLSAVGRALKLIKDQLRTIPARGFNYGLLRYLNRDAGAQLAALPTPQLAFNYLGRFAAQEGALWLPTGDAAGFGGGADPEMPLNHLVEIDAVVADAPEGPRLTATSVGPKIIWKSLPFVSWHYPGSGHWSPLLSTLACAAISDTVLRIFLCSLCRSSRLNR